MRSCWRRGWRRRCRRAGAATILNGSFETSTDPNAPGASSYSTLYAGDTTITGWTVGGYGIDYINGYWNASDGTHSLDLSAADEGSISQTFATDIGTAYSINFDLAGNPDGQVKHLDVSATGAVTKSYTFDTAGHDLNTMGWTTKTYDFTATAASTTLSFLSRDHSDAGPALDNVRFASGVASVPEPASWAMMVIGFGAVGGAMRCRQRGAVRVA